jgi:pimeloyl-ACP methyl ester carboxylesterase
MQYPDIENREKGDRVPTEPEVPEVVVVVAAGLGAINPAAGIYYRQLCRHTGAHLVVPHGAGFGSSSDTYRYFEADFDRLSAGGKRLIIIGHSLGAIHAVRYAAHHDNVAFLMLIGMPVEGSLWCHLIQSIAPVFRDLKPNSDFLAEMHHLLIRVAPITTCVEVSFDLFVVPSRACHVHGADRYLRFRAPWVNHASVVAHPRVRGEVDYLIREASRRPVPPDLATASL